MSLYGNWKRIRGDSTRPDLLAVAKQLLGYLENQRRLSGVQTLSIRRRLPDGSMVEASFFGDQPIVRITAAQSSTNNGTVFKLRAYIALYFYHYLDAGNESALLLIVDLDEYLLPVGAATLEQAQHTQSLNKPIAYGDPMGFPTAPLGLGQSPPAQLNGSMVSKNIVYSDSTGAVSGGLYYLLPGLLLGGSAPTYTDLTQWATLYGLPAVDAPGVFKSVAIDPTRQRIFFFCNYVRHVNAGSLVSDATAGSVWVIDATTNLVLDAFLISDVAYTYPGIVPPWPTTVTSATRCLAPAGYLNTNVVFCGGGYSGEIFNEDAAQAKTITVSNRNGDLFIPVQYQHPSQKRGCIIISAQTMQQSGFIDLGTDIVPFGYTMEQNTTGSRLYFVRQAYLSGTTTPDIVSGVDVWGVVENAWVAHWVATGTYSHCDIVGPVGPSLFLCLTDDAATTDTVLVLDATTLIAQRQFSVPKSTTFFGKGVDDSILYGAPRTPYPYGTVRPFNTFSALDGTILTSFNPLSAVPTDSYHRFDDYQFTRVNIVAVQ